MAAMAALLVAGSAAAQTSDDGVTRLAPTDDTHIEALFQAQQTGDGVEAQSGAETLTREQIATYRSESGWGKAFKEMQANGYFQDYKNFGQLISASKSKQGGTENASIGDQANSFEGIELDRTHKAHKAHKVHKIHKVRRVQRVSRVDRPKRPDRPNRPARR